MSATQKSEIRTDDDKWRAVCERTPSDEFVYAVTTTGVVCRPGCPSRAPRRANVVFFATVEDARRAGFRRCTRCHAPSATVNAVTRACRWLEAQGEGEALRSRDLARALGMTPSSFARAFRKTLGITPRQYRRRVLAERARAALVDAPSVTEAIYAAGYGASSRFYESAGQELGMTPRSALGGGRNQRVFYAVRPTSLGPLGIVWTERGVSDVWFADEASSTLPTLQATVRQRWPNATRAGAPVPGWLASVLGAVEKATVAADVPLDIRGTAFQELVWQALRKIPAGETRSYAQMAAAIGKPSAQRAVARAIGANPIAVLVPCHRVVGKDGALTGYRWGLERKRELLRREACQRAVRKERR